MFTDYIDQLYYGELNPCRECKLNEDTMDKTTRTLVRIASARAFRCGFALGAKLMREIDET